MTHEQIRTLALQCGFKLKPQLDGQMDLNHYVIDFAETLISQGREKQAIIQLERQDRIIGKLKE